MHAPQPGHGQNPSYPQHAGGPYGPQGVHAQPGADYHGGGQPAHAQYAPAPHQANSNPVDPRVVQAALSAKTWLNVVGWLFVVSGVLNALTLVGVVVAWIPIWCGVMLIGAANAAGRLGMSRTNDDLFQFVDKIRTYFAITGIMAVIAIVGSILVMAIFGASILAMAAAVAEAGAY